MEDNIFDSYRFPCPSGCPGWFKTGTAKNFIFND